jgi:hypothetical protein
VSLRATPDASFKRWESENINKENQMAEEPSEEQQSKFDQLIEKIEAQLGEVNETKTLAAQATAEANTAKTESTASLQSTKQTLDQVNALLAQAKTHQQELQALLEKSKTDSAKTAEIARTADEKDNRVQEYEKKLTELKKNYEAINEKIDDLLPGASSAGLAKAFNIRKKALSPTRWTAIGIFLLSVLGFIAIGLWAVLGAGIKEWGDFILFTVERSPIILGLIVLEEFSRRLFNNTIKLEEDYAYKETLSMAFDGYQKAMTEVQTAAKDTLAHTLCENVLSALKERPGRLLEHAESDDEKLPIQALIAQEASSTGGPTAGLIGKVYDDLKSSIKGSALKVLIIIIVAISIGIIAGRYSADFIGKDKNNPNQSIHSIANPPGDPAGVQARSE